ncbi:hypothetical protein BAUCODRAFT_61278 [Baudoinia panamericana UAMH 10762]|uniref:Kinetochore protein SPC25 n=1 Tax=Baudoinia panamericana (strain UAMH 10762) TaxID=717646 RepID=M2NNG7_BAUPA|nr:uncharacterized protein BAUCODRAFT_61278 [Baudoinia panamericana UAMH 10762]EMD00781.1 hypothetical protein BAUCODRAFT_61278 [Baudoinia panamericana UAMH 10762]
MTPLRFSSSLSGSTAQYAANAPSMADTLPSIDFGFNDLRERMAQFTARFDEFIESGRKRVLEERNAFRMSVAEMEESVRHKEQSIAALEAKSSTHADAIAKEVAETEEMHNMIQQLTLQKEEHIVRRDALKEEIVAVQGCIKQRREAQTAHQRSLDAQARNNIPELRFWEHALGLKIEGTGIDDSLRFVFLNLDERDGETEVWFELQMGGKEYEIGATKPKLERERVAEVREKLNASRELGGFLKGMRNLLVQAMRLR